MGTRFWTHQKDMPDTDPWQELGDSETLGEIPLCEAQEPLRRPLIRTIAHRRFPLERTPFGDPPSGESLQLGALLTGPDADYPKVSAHSSWGELRDIICADEIQPVVVDTTTGMVSGLFNSGYDLGRSEVPARRSNGELTGYCYASVIAGRRVHPLLRIVDWNGYTLRLRFSGTVPKACYYPGEIPSKRIVRVRFGLNETNSWAHVIAEINENQELWTLDDTGLSPWCRHWTLTFDAWLPLPFCDTTVDMWMVSDDDDARFQGEPISEMQPWADGPDLSIIGAQVVL